MQSINPGKLEKLEKYIRKLVEDLNGKDQLKIRLAINEFYYIQKAEELKILKERCQDAPIIEEILQDKLCEHYNEIFCSWRHDVRLLNKHATTVSGILPNEKRDSSD